MGYNLACILTFPSVQRKGYGRFLIAFSYELSKKEEKAGSPEKPLSDLGAVGYKSYWAHTILKLLRDYPGQSLSVMDITRITSILPDDVHATLLMLNLLHYVNNSSGSSAGGDSLTSGAMVISNNNTSTSMESTGKESITTGNINNNNNTNISADASKESEYYVIYAPVELIDTLLLKYPENRLPVQAEKLHWAPLYVTDPKKDKWSIKSLLTVREQKEVVKVEAAVADVVAIGGK